MNGEWIQVSFFQELRNAPAIKRLVWLLKVASQKLSCELRRPLMHETLNQLELMALAWRAWYTTQAWHNRHLRSCCACTCGNTQDLTMPAHVLH